MNHAQGGLPSRPPAPDVAAVPTRSSVIRPLWQRQLPNALTNARLVLAAAFFVVLSRWHIDGSSALDANKSSTDNVLLLAALLFVLAAVTDALDGFFARLWKVQSVFGRVMDPFADKILVLGGFVLLAGSAFTSRQFPRESFSCVEPWMVIVILARELLVTSLRGMVESRGHSFAATASGKWKMILQSVCIPFVLVMIATRDVRPDVGADTHGDGWDMAVPGARMLVMICVYLTVTVTAWSAFPYLSRAIRVLRQPPPAPPPTSPAEVSSLVVNRSLSPAHVFWITSLGLGRLRPAPGTWGSLPPVALAGAMIFAGLGPRDSSPAIAFYTLVLLAVCAWFSMVCVRWGDGAESHFGRKDPGSVTADETAGMCLTLLFLPHPASSQYPLGVGAVLASAFLAFRLTDILKPFPAYRLQRVPGGWGILLDDLVAGVQALVLVQMLWRWLIPAL